MADTKYVIKKSYYGTYQVLDPATNVVAFESTNKRHAEALQLALTSGVVVPKKSLGKEAA